MVVLGAGPAGEVAAGRLADGGLEVAIVEPHLIGGECSFYACMPSKGAAAAGRAAGRGGPHPGRARGGHRRARRAPRCSRRRDEIIHDLDDSEPGAVARGQGHRRWCAATAASTARRRVRVGDELLAARRAVVVSTGSGATVPPIDGLREASRGPTARSTTAKEVPERLAGARRRRGRRGDGAGVEHARLAASRSSSAADRLIAREEEFASELVADGLRERGVDIRLGVRATAARARRRRGRARARLGRTRARRRAARGGRPQAEHRRASGSTRSASSPASRSRWTTSCARTTGSTRSAT